MLTLTAGDGLNANQLQVMKNILGQVAEPIIDVKNKMGGNENPGSLRIGLHR